MSALFEIQPITFRVAAPDSKKNRGHILSWGPKCPHCHTQPHQGFRPSPIALKQEARIRDFLSFQLDTREPHFADHSVRVLATHFARSDELAIAVEDLGPRPKGFTGRRRDLANLLEVILDAMQGPVYANDNQVAEIEIRRSLT